jgi:post-segregation antitoxin (ccd killing protein)
MGRRQHSSLQTRRTTLSLPADLLSEAERIARARKVNVSTVIGEALSEGLRLQTAAERSSEVLERYKKAFSGFSDSEMAILDGVILQPTNRK